MTSLLLSVIAATTLAVAGVGAPSETRSAQSLPKEHLVMPTGDAAATGKLHSVNRMAAGSSSGDWDHTDKVQCDAHHWHWYTGQNRCHRQLVPVFLIGAATAAGLGYALASSDGHGSSGQSSMSH